MKFNPLGDWDDYMDFAREVLDLPIGFSDYSHVLDTKLVGTICYINDKLEYIMGFDANYLYVRRDGEAKSIYYSSISTFGFFLPKPGWYSIGELRVKLIRNMGVQYKLSYNSNMYSLSGGNWQFVDWNSHQWIYNGKFYNCPHINLNPSLVNFYA